MNAQLRIWQLRIWRLRILSVVLLAAVIASITLPAVAQKLSSRLVAAGRQHVRAELAAAMADGELTDKERQWILYQAKQFLSPIERMQMERAVERLSAQSEASCVSGPDPPAEKNADENTVENTDENTDDQPGSGRIAQTSLLAEDDASDEPDVSPAKADGPESPFLEEDSEETFTFERLDDVALACTSPECAPENSHSVFCNGWQHISLSTSIEAFKGPLDLDNQNGNFGLQFGINAGFPAIKRWGVGVQVGTSAVLSDFHGTQFTGDTIRSQNFTTVGLYQRVPMAQRLQWGFAFDWLYDDYYDSLSMSQWRVKLGYDLTPRSEIGIWAAIPDEGDNALLQGGAAPIFNRFKPVAQGNLYYQHCLDSGTSLTAWLGLAEEPGEIIFGADARVPITRRLALFGGFNYIEPSANGVGGQDEEMWSVSLGIEFTPGYHQNHCRSRRRAPFFPLANNGTFAIRRF